MVLHVLRGLFLLLLAAVGWFYLKIHWLVMAIALGIGVLFVCVDILAPRRKLAVFSGLLFGLTVGVVVSYILSFAITLIADQSAVLFPSLIGDTIQKQGAEFAKLIVALVTCYLTISFTLQTKDDFRFIIPYVEFKKNTRGPRPFIVDTSVLIDGRIADITPTGLIDGQLVVPRFVLEELQAIADSGDRLKRNRGRRGLDILGKLRAGSRVEVILYEPHDRQETPSKRPTDQLLIDLAAELNGRLLTTDYNLNKVSQLRGLDVVNLNDLANAIKPVVLPGERLMVKLVKAGESPTQGVGYLDDGTMVVVEQGRQAINEEVEVTVTSALQTSAGRMIFGRLGDVTTRRDSSGNNTTEPAA